jgi:hypothetical protein
MKEINPIALFRLSVLGPLVSRDRLHLLFTHKFLI